MNPAQLRAFARASAADRGPDATTGNRAHFALAEALRNNERLRELLIRYVARDQERSEVGMTTTSLYREAAAFLKGPK